MSLYKNQFFTPMLLSEKKIPFNDLDYIFEMKFDGIRVLLFVGPDEITIRNRRSSKLNYRYPELLNIKKLVKKKVIFDGEIVTMINGKPDFEKLKERESLRSKFKVTYYSKNYPVIFMAYDILYEGKDLIDLPLMKRKKILSKYKDTDTFVKVEYIEEKGKELFKLIKDNNLEGIIAKRKDSLYTINKRSKDWIKIKNFQDEDFYICGYKEEANNAVASLLLGKKKNNKIEYVSSVTIGKKNPEYMLIKKIPKDNKAVIKKNGYINIKPQLECTVEFAEKTKGGSLRQPKYKGLRY